MRKIYGSGCFVLNTWRNIHFFCCNPKPGDSSVWKGILSSKELVLSRACFKVEDG